MNSINYTDFKTDCDTIFGELLKKYSFTETYFSEEDFEVIYENKFWKVQISMLSNFPYIGVSFDFYNLEGNNIKRSILDKALKVDSRKESEMFKAYAEAKDMNLYINQMLYGAISLDSIYKPLLSGEFRYSDYLIYASEN